MTAIFFFKASLIVFSALATGLSLVFMLAPELFNAIEEFLGFEFGGSTVFLTALEGRVMFLHNWVFSNRFVFGPILSLLAAVNTHNAFFLPTPV
ncbi:MAG: hypothetical protein ACM3L6_05130 [Deltaproteobacteria bacterium]